MHGTSCPLSPEASGTLVTPGAGSSSSSSSLRVPSDTHSQLRPGSWRGGQASPGALGGPAFSSCLGDGFVGWTGAAVSEPQVLAGPPSAVAFPPGEAPPGPSTRNLQDHGPRSSEAGPVEPPLGPSPEELRRSAARGWVWTCRAFQQLSGGTGPAGPALPTLGADAEELAASSKAAGAPSLFWGTLGPSVLGGASMTPVMRPGIPGPWPLGSLGKKASSSSPSPAPLRGGSWPTSGSGTKPGSRPLWRFSGPSSVSSSEESTSRMASCFCRDSRRSARSWRRVPRAREGAGCSTPFPGSTLLVPTTSRGLTSLGGSSFFSSGWGRSRLCFREAASFFSEAASAAASFSADWTLLRSGERGGSALLGRESCRPRGGDR